MEEFERAYTTSEIAARLKTAQSTIRKYAMALEKHGYTFSKNSTGARLYVERDVATLTRMKELSAEAKMPIDQIAGMLGATAAAPHSVTRDVAVSEGVATPEIFTEIMTEFAALRKENAELKEMVQELAREVTETRQLLVESVEAPPHPAAIEQPEEEEIALFDEEPVKELVRESAAVPSKRFWEFWRK